LLIDLGTEPDTGLGDSAVPVNTAWEPTSRIWL
jgi:hypothetical protein